MLVLVTAVMTALQVGGPRKTPPVPPGATLSERRTWLYHSLLRLHAFDEGGVRTSPKWLLFPRGESRHALVIVGDRIGSYTFYGQALNRQWESKLVPRAAKDGLPPEGTLGRYLESGGRWLWNRLWPVPEHGIAAAGPWANDRESPTDYALYGFAGGKVYLKSLDASGTALPGTVAEAGVGTLPILPGEDSPEKLGEAAP